jgi:polysaccharide deacetylase 2 family uncharacterized protein YibQ
MAVIGITGEDARPGMRVLALAYVAAGAALFLLVFGIWLFGNSHAGDPVVRLALKPASPINHAARAKAPSHAPNEQAVINGVPPPGSVPPSAQPGTPTLPPPASGEPTVPANVVPGSITKPVYAGSALVADPAMIEQTSDGPLPRIADNGRAPIDAYAAPAPPAGRPKIAIVITGLGFSARETSAALAQLPAAVTLAFAPYSNDAQRWVGEARKQGHEVLVEVPMEPYDFPDSDPGPHTLRAGVDDEANTQRLVWALTRFTGYTGITNLLGSRFLADQDSLAPILTFLTRRGLLFYDNGSVSRSQAPQVAKRTGTAFAQGAVTIDRIQTAMEIDRRLSELETRARANGSASGTGFVYPVTMERVALWAQGLNGRGFVLVPASAIVARSN